MDSELKLPERPGFLPPAVPSQQFVTCLWNRPFLKGVCEAVLPALFIAIVTVLVIVQPVRVDGDSMAPTLHAGQRLVVEKTMYHFRDPGRGEVVVFKLPGRNSDPLIKRVIAVGGDVVAIQDGRVYLNGSPLRESYQAQLTMGDLPSTVVPEDHIFVLGDNRSASNDSRLFGMVPDNRVLGRAIISYWPLIGFVR